MAGATVASVLALSDVTDGGTVEWVVACSAGADGTGSTTPTQATDVTLSADGSSYTTSCTGGNLCLLPPSGSSSLTPTWVTLGGRPIFYDQSAAVYTLNLDGSLGTRISPVLDSVDNQFGGTLLGNAAADFSGTGVADGQRDEWVLVCFSEPGGTGAGDENMFMYVTLSADGSLYTTSTTPPLATTTLTASPQPTLAGDTLTLTATVTAADGTHPAGSVVFAPTTGCCIPVAVNADGVATTSEVASYSHGPYTLFATFTPADIFSSVGSTGTLIETVSLPVAGLNRSRWPCRRPVC
jgi:hypothetical protein